MESRGRIAAFVARQPGWVQVLLGGLAAAVIIALLAASPWLKFAPDRWWVVLPVVTVGVLALGVFVINWVKQRGTP